MPAEDLLSNQISSVEVSLPAYNLRQFLFGLDLRPIDGFAAKPYVNAIFKRQSRIHGADCRIEVEVSQRSHRREPANVGRVASDLAEFGIGHVFSIDVTVNRLLLGSIPEFNDYVAHLFREPWIANQGNVEVLFLSKGVVIAQAHQRAPLEGRKNGVIR